MCLKKNLKSPQWLRDLKFKKYPFWRLDKPKNLQIIENGGWHFAYLHSAENISKKIKSFAHGEFNLKHLTDEEEIKKELKKDKMCSIEVTKLRRLKQMTVFQIMLDIIKNYLKIGLYNLVRPEGFEPSTF